MGTMIDFQVHTGQTSTSTSTKYACQYFVEPMLQVWLLACWLTMVACSSWQDEHYAQFQQQLQRIQQQPRQFGERNGYSHKFTRGREYQEPDSKQALFGELRQFGPPEGKGYSWDSFEHQQAVPWKDGRGNAAVIPQQHVYSPEADGPFQDELSRRDDFHQQSNSNQREYVPQHSNPLPHDFPVQDDFPRQEEMVRLGERVAWEQGEARNRWTSTWVSLTVGFSGDNR